VGPFPLLLHLFQMIARLWVGFSGQQTWRVLGKSYNETWKLWCTTMRSSPNNSQFLVNKSKLKTWMAVKGQSIGGEMGASLDAGVGLLADFSIRGQQKAHKKYHQQEGRLREGSSWWGLRSFQRHQCCRYPFLQ
jgi:hypothetical protein